jgi:hypothetical protein
MIARLDDLDGPDYPAYRTGRAAEVLRALDAAGVATGRTVSGHDGPGTLRSPSTSRDRVMLGPGADMTGEGDGAVASIHQDVAVAREQPVAVQGAFARMSS